jgi:tetratricopeptide (TPR) repeat protein
MARPMTLPNISRPTGGMAGPANPPSFPRSSSMPAFRLNQGGFTRPMPRPTPMPGGNRPGPGNIVGTNRPGQGGPGGGPRPGIQRPGIDRGPALVGGGNRPGPGAGNRPGLGDNRPGPGGNWPGFGGNRPDFGGNRPGYTVNRPGFGNDRPGRPGFGDNLGIVNRPNYRNVNVVANRNVTGNRLGVGVGNRGGDGWFGGGNRDFDGRGWGDGRGWSGYGWRSPYDRYHGNWYRGRWGRNQYGGWLAPVGYGYGYGFWPGGGLYNSFPSWGYAGLAGWGLGSWANNWLNPGYANPYYIAPAINTAVVANVPPTVVYDYGRPLDLTSVPSEPSIAALDDSTFRAARDAFRTGDYASALSLTDLALQQLPNDPVLHEFRALCLFALGRYDEAAATLYAVLSAGPGWDWPTMISLYPDVQTYTNQLRALEAAVRSNPESASARFVLGYHYMVQGHVEQARQQFQEVVRLQPNNALAAQFVRLLSSSSAAPAATPPVGPNQTEATPQPGPPPAPLVGTWRANPSPDVNVGLTVQDNGRFTWDVNSKGQRQSITGQAGYRDGVLTLTQAEGPPLVGKVEYLGDNHFGLQMRDGQKDSTINFRR